MKKSKPKQAIPLLDCRKLLRIMKLLLVCLLLGTNSMWGKPSYAQQTTLDLNLNHVELQEVFEVIRQQSEFEFFYNNDQVDASIKVSVMLKGADIKKVLEQVLPAKYEYKINDRYVLISKKKEQTQNETTFKLKGIVVDNMGEPLPGTNIVVLGGTRGVATDIDGSFEISVSIGEKLTASYLGMDDLIITVKDKKELIITMKPKTDELEEVTIVAFAKQKKQSVVASITTINPEELKGPTSNLTTMLAGRISGMISYQRSGEPGQDNAQFFIRGVGSFGAGKVDPLILVDGIESTATDLARLQPDDIASFSVLKDATASAVYGARGANGVVLVNTKTGKEGKTHFSFRAENSISTNTRNFKFADNITYMELANEAALTRDPLSPLTYPQAKIDMTKAGANPILYPNNNWIDQLIKPNTVNQRFNTSISGGGKVARYYISGTFNIDNGVLKNDSKNNFNNNIKLNNYSVRSNTDLQITKTTEASVRVYGQFDDYSGPIGGGGNIFNSVVWANPVAFPAVYPASYSPHTNHPMFGSALVPNSSSQLYTNPYAEMVSGYQMYNTTTVNAQIEFKQDFGFILPGLKARAMGYTQRYSYFDSSRKYNPYYYSASVIDEDLYMRVFNDGTTGSVGTTGSEYLNYSEGSKKVNTTYYGEFSADYNHLFAGKHAVTGMLIGQIRNYVSGNAGSLEASLPARNIGLSGRFTYGFDSKYMLEFNFGYNGSERFAKNKRWGFFPSIGGGWNISNEPFFEPVKRAITNLKVRGSYGLIGNDQIGGSADRFFYMSNVNLNNGDRGYVFGEEFRYSRPGVSVSRYANDQIGWEESRQINLGVDLDAFGVNLVVDAFQQKRSNILMERSFIPGTMGLQVRGSANVGKAESKGIDASLNYNKHFTNDFWTQLRANFTYATSKINVYDEPNYPADEYYRSRVGYPVNQVWGYIAERLFIDDFEVANSAKQSFGKYEAGDIKYRDVNGDGQITGADMVPIGYPTSPEINYGFGGTVGFKNIDFNVFFQGSGRSSFFINPGNISPFAIDKGKQNGLLEVVANDHWSEDNRNSYAFWPRLSNVQRDNNNQTSTWWLRNGTFLRLKSLEVGYNLPKTYAKKIGTDLRLYVNATNLFVISKFKMWDPEMGGSGLGYPVQRTFNIGLSINL